MPKSVIAQYTEISAKVKSVGVRFSVVAKFFCDYVFIRFTNFSYLVKVQHSESGRCLDSMGRKNGEKVGIVNCHGMGGNQVYQIRVVKSPLFTHIDNMH